MITLGLRHHSAKAKSNITLKQSRNATPSKMTLTLRLNLKDGSKDSPLTKDLMLIH